MERQLLRFLHCALISPGNIMAQNCLTVKTVRRERCEAANRKMQHLKNKTVAHITLALALVGIPEK